MWAPGILTGTMIACHGKSLGGGILNQTELHLRDIVGMLQISDDELDRA